MSLREYQPLHGPDRMRVGRREDRVTLQLQHGTWYALKPGEARELAHRLERKADLADPEGARR